MADILRHNHQTHGSRVNIQDMRPFLIIATLTLMSVHSLADTVWLTNGDRISGEIEQLDETTLKVKTAYAPAINIERSAIQSFATDTSKTWLHQSRPRATNIMQSTDPGYVVMDSIPVPITELLLKLEEAPPNGAKMVRLEPVLMPTREPTGAGKNFT